MADEQNGMLADALKDVIEVLGDESGSDVLVGTGVARRVLRPFFKQTMFVYPNGNRVTLPTFEIRETVDLPLGSTQDEFHRQIHKLLDRVRDREDNHFFNIVKAVVDANDGGHNLLIAGIAQGSPTHQAEYTDDLDEFMKPIQDSGLQVAAILFSPSDYAKRYRYTSCFTRETNNDLLRRHIMGHYREAVIFQTRHVKAGEVIVIGKRKSVEGNRDLFDAVFVEDTPVTLTSKEVPSQAPTSIQVEVFETIGLGIYGSMVQRIKLAPETSHVPHI